MPDFERFDQRRYPKVPVREGYGDWTPTYEDTVEDAMDLALLERIDGVAWQELGRIADLGCGTGRIGAWLRTKASCPVDGVDLTPEMLERARDREIYDRLLEADVTATGLERGAYDLATCCLVDEHLPTLEPLYAEAARVLRPAGAFVLIGYHPAFMMRAGMPTHFEHDSRGNVAFETHLHLLSDHVHAARSAGFVATELHERVIDEDWVRRKPKWKEYWGWPVSFAWRWQR